MRLLFITQKVDKNDDVLGVYHRWLEKLAGNFEKIRVICLFRGVVELPPNIEVYSLGKEIGVSKLGYFLNFFKYIIRLRSGYDVVFVHMNPEYLILGGWLWKLLGKKIVFWYAHYLATTKLKIASLFADRIVTSTRLAYPLESKKLIVLQQGIDTERFKPAGIKNQESGIRKFKVLFLGRIAPVKNLEVLLKSIELIRKDNSNISLTVVGGPTPGKTSEVNYFNKIKKLAADLNLDGGVEFLGSVPNVETQAIYRNHNLFVNLTDTGSFDKSTLEAMACGLPVIISNKAFLEIFNQDLIGKLIFRDKDPQDLAQKIVSFMKLRPAEINNISDAMRQIILDKHDLNRLAKKLSEALTF